MNIYLLHEILRKLEAPLAWQLTNKKEDRLCVLLLHVIDLVIKIIKQFNTYFTKKIEPISD